MRAIGAGTISKAQPGTERPCTFIVQEACDAGTLRKVVTEQVRLCPIFPHSRAARRKLTHLLQPLLFKQQRYSNLQAIRWLHEVAQALAHMHAQTPPIAHRYEHFGCSRCTICFDRPSLTCSLWPSRDLKLANIFLRSCAALLSIAASCAVIRTGLRRVPAEELTVAVPVAAVTEEGVREIHVVVGDLGLSKALPAAPAVESFSLCASDCRVSCNPGQPGNPHQHVTGSQPWHAAARLHHQAMASHSAADIQPS